MIEYCHLECSCWYWSVIAELGCFANKNKSDNCVEATGVFCNLNTPRSTSVCEFYEKGVVVTRWARVRWLRALWNMHATWRGTRLLIAGGGVARSSLSHCERDWLAAMPKIETWPRRSNARWRRLTGARAPLPPPPDYTCARDGARCCWLICIEGWNAHLLQPPGISPSRRISDVCTSRINFGAFGKRH
jgi:hypothetical protein